MNLRTEAPDIAEVTTTALLLIAASAGQPSRSLPTARVETVIVGTTTEGNSKVGMTCMAMQCAGGNGYCSVVRHTGSPTALMGPSWP